MKNNENHKPHDNKIASWYRLAETSKWLIFVHIFWGLIRVAGLITSPIYAAKVTVSLVAGNYSTAIMYLAIELGIVFITYSAYFQVYVNAGKLFKNTYMTVQHKIYQKAYRAKDSNFKVTSKEKLLNIIGNDVDVVSNFADTLGCRISRGVQVVITIVIVFISNWAVGLAILGLSVINLFVLLKLNKNITKHRVRMYENKDKLYEQFSQILSNQPLIKQYDMGKTVAEDYFDRCEKYAKSNHKRLVASGIKENYFIVFYKFMIFLITCLMITLVQNNTLPLETYFVLVPYLLTSVELMNELINLTFSLEETDVSTKRINTVLNFTDAEFIAYGQASPTGTDSKLTLLNVSYKIKNSQYKGKLENVTMKFAYTKLNVIKGPAGCGKRIIFGLIARQIVPDSGILMLNEINMLEYSKSAYKSFVFNTLGKPMFLNDSIAKNFAVTGASPEKIERHCRGLGVYDYIMQLPNRFDTNIYSSEISKEKAFLINLAIASLMNSQIISIYEIPENLNSFEINEIKDTLRELVAHKTVILFTHSDIFDDIAAVTYTMENGQIASVKENQQLKSTK